MYSKTKFSSTPVHFANLLEGFMNNDFSNLERRVTQAPSVNIRENDDSYDLHLLAPALRKEDFKIDVDKNILTISFLHKEETKETEDKWLRQEFKTSSFKRSFSLNEKIDTSAINASYQNGILQVNLPKKEKEELKSLSISVN